MKLRAAALLLSCPLSLAVPLHAAPVAAQARAAAPIELHIEAQATAAADGVDIVLAVTGSGGTEAEAMAQLKINHDALVAELRERGIDPAGLTFTRNTQNEEMISSVRSDSMSAAPSEPDKKKKKSSGQDVEGGKSAGKSYVYREEDVTIRLASLDQAQQMLAWTASQGEAFVVMSAKSSVSDPAKARRAAREQALAQARKDAEEYAALMGYHVVRMVRVSNARAPLNMPDIVEFIMTMEKSGLNRGAEMRLTQPIETISVDFLIAPN